MYNNKKLNIFLILLCFGFLIFCIFTCIYFTQEIDRTVVLVKDAGYNDRLISDKTDALSNSQSPGELLFQGETPDGYINPEDYFKDDTEILDNTDGRIDLSIINSDETNPLTIRDPNEILEVIQEEAKPQEPTDEVQMRVDQLLRKARELRNMGLSDFGLKGVGITSITDGMISVNDVTDNKGGIIVPFSIENITVIEPFMQYYSEDVSKVPILFLNTSYSYREKPSEIRNSLKENGMPEDIEFYYDPEYIFMMGAELSSDEYMVFNSDGYLVERRTLDDMSALDVVIDSLYRHSEMADEMDSKIENGVITTLEELLQYCREVGINIDEV